MMIRSNIIILALVITFQPFGSMAQSPKEVLDKMLISISQLKSLSYSTKISERIDGTMVKGTSHVKVNLHPFKVYLKMPSAEVLFVQGENNNKALVKSSSIPYFNLNLDPTGAILRKGQHHTIFETGFNYFSEIIKKAYKTVGDDFDKYFTLKGSINWEGNDCYVVVIEYPDFKFVPYEVQRGEDLVKIAKKFLISEYMILERNPGIKDYYSVVPGQKILIPNVYAPKTIVYIDKKNNLPIVQVIYDEKGIFARYEFQNIKINPVFSEKEFTKDFKGYNF